jgi:hypothetical protein
LELDRRVPWVEWSGVVSTPSPTHGLQEEQHVCITEMRQPGTGARQARTSQTRT